MTKKIELLIVSGYSGTGKTYALKNLEALGYYCVDNLPIELVDNFLDLYLRTHKSYKIAVCIDIRSTFIFDNCHQIIKNLKDKGFKIKLLFLTSDKKVLLQRYQETRSRHPLSNIKGKHEDITLDDAIDLEFKLLNPLRAISDIIIDTSNKNIHQLREHIFSIFLEDNKKLTIRVISFGFSKGIPLDCDMVFDVRFLPNPYFENDLKHMTGKDKKIANFLNKKEEMKKFWKKFSSLLKFLIPQYEKEGKSYLTIGIGCTGGRHRSVYIAEKFKKLLSKYKYYVIIEHRDLI